MNQEERARMLATAAQLLDRRHATLGPGEAPATTPEGDIARMFAADSAELGLPTVHRLDLPQASAETRGGPVGRSELTRAYRYYWLEFPLSLWTQPGRGFNCLEFGVAFNPSQHDARRPVAFDAIPNQAFAARFQAESQFTLGVDAGFKFSAELPALPIPIDAGIFGLSTEADADLEATTRTKLIFGPFRCALRTPVVERTATGLPHVLWRLKEASFEQENDPGLRVVLRVPKDLASLRISAHVRATRYFNLLDAGLQRAIRDLPKAIASFFTGGTPVTASQTWDMSDRL
jgi:hypothetical protein